MDYYFEEKYHRLESGHWWFKTRREIVTSLIKPDKGNKYLDIGCSGAMLLEDLHTSIPKKNLFGIDISSDAISIAQKKGFENTFVMDAENPQFNENQFDCITVSDCLEHLENEASALKNWFKILNTNGTIIVFVPAFMFLWSLHDVANHHFRRYTQRQLIKAMKDAGFHVVRSGYWNFSLFVPVLFIRQLKRVITKNKKEVDDMALLPQPLNFFLIMVLRLENLFIKTGINFPFGISTYCLATKKSTATQN